MTRVAALLGLMVACLAVGTSAAPALTRTQLVLPQDLQNVQQDQSQNCQLCLAAVTVGEGFLIGSGEIQDLIKKLTDDLCSRFSPEQQQECTELVPAVAAGVIQWARVHWPAEKICESVDLCDATMLSSSQVMAMVDDSAAMLEVTNPTLKAVLGDNEEKCDTCKLIVTQVATMLRNPETQKEILEYAHDACHVFPGFEDQCEMYVNMYGPLVMGIIQQYLQPDAMCGRLGFCPLPPALN
ncbi:hypothetical protein ABBQ38_003281 [Trebouxia sp. C0009 RCD-2024]